MKIEDEEDEEKRLKAVGWSDLHPELLAQIFPLLDVVEYVRCLSVCASWRSIPEKTLNFCKPKRGRQLPWLLTTTAGDEHSSLCFHGLNCLHTKMAKRTLRLHRTVGYRCIGSSQGFIITVNGSLKFRVTNPLTGAHFPLPPTATHPDIHIYDEHRLDAPPRLIVPDRYTKLFPGYRKAIISPSLDTIAVAVNGHAKEDWVYNYFGHLAFARAGDHSLMPPSTTWRDMEVVHDLVFHKGRLYVLYRNGYPVVFDLENPAAPPLISPGMDIVPRDALLTETPDGEDLLLLWRDPPTFAGILGSTTMVVFRASPTYSSKFGGMEWNMLGICQLWRD